MVPLEERRADMPFLDPGVMGPPIVWLASTAATGVHDQRIVAKDFDDWLRAHCVA
jgi:gluconate 5-dehydrogenase